MVGGRMKNPLNQRVLRELAGEWRKYLVVFIFLSLTIGAVSGVDVANDSMTKAIKNNAVTYKLEDGHFVLEKSMSSDLRKEIEKKNVTLYRNFYKNLKAGKNGSRNNDGKIRIYQMQSWINQPCVMKGRLPKKAGEIAIDRMHADNSGIKIGDRIRAGDRTLKVVGLIARPDYSTLFERNSDTMFDALSFDVGLVSKEEFSKLGTSVKYDYSWKYINSPANDYKEKKIADQLMKTIAVNASMDGNMLDDYVPNYLNQAIQFAPEDMGSDKTMANVFLFILVAVIAFIFAVTINSTIEKEATVIGTLRASGYTRGELLRHYMAAPILVTAAAAVTGNILGYTFLKNVVVSMYYNSYSLTTYETVWNSQAFRTTTVIPVILMLVITSVSIYWKLRLSPRQFLRHEMHKVRRKRARRIPNVSFMRRFRIRILLQNVSGYLVMFIGIVLVLLLMVFAQGINSSMKYYQKNAVDQMFAKHQYVLTQTVDSLGRPIRTDTKGAEKYSVRELETCDSSNPKESVSVYGLREESSYIALPKGLKKNEVVITSAYSEKYGCGVGDTINVKEKYENKKYRFKVRSVVPYIGALNVFMTNGAFCDTFDLDQGSWNGYLSDRTISDIDNKYIVSEISEEDVTKISRQLDHSLGAYMQYFEYICVILAAALLYLLTKNIIERSERPISLLKILGYEDREIASLYLTVTTIFVTVSEAAALFIDRLLATALWRSMMRQMVEGWFDFHLEIRSYIILFLMVFAAYLIISRLDFRRIRRVPMDLVLKNVE